MINRIVLIVLDSAGIGDLPDADKYGDIGTNTIKHCLDFMGSDFVLPNMAKLGLYKLLEENKIADKDIIGSYGKMMTKAPAKDTIAGHWEMMGYIIDKAMPVYPNGFPKEIIETYEKSIGTKIIGNCPASGTEIINKLGDEHLRTGYPIVYTSADSVFQVACHEERFGLQKLYDICKIARQIMSGDNAIGRIIARPFIGSNGKYARTENRKDYSLSPKNTVLDDLKAAGGETIAIGKIEDIFNFCGITKSFHTRTNADGMKETLEQIKNKADKKTLIFTNLVDFDMLWGHRRDAAAYAKGLKDFDDLLPQLINSLDNQDMLIITADHGCDPAYKKHTDHTREFVPLLVYGKFLKQNVDLGIRGSLSDIGQTIADIFDLKAKENGESFKREI
ncbi:MAG: phosphopentomutase [Elusimicrobiota bacterium]|nr:phosphopentomutase [Elusimicrobiota bacterium]